MTHRPFVLQVCQHGTAEKQALHLEFHVPHQTYGKTPQGHVLKSPLTWERTSRNPSPLVQASETEEGMVDAADLSCHESS